MGSVEPRSERQRAPDPWPQGRGVPAQSRGSTGWLSCAQVPPAPTGTEKPLRRPPGQGRTGPWHSQPARCDAPSIAPSGDYAAVDDRRGGARPGGGDANGTLNAADHYRSARHRGQHAAPPPSPGQPSVGSTAEVEPSASAAVAHDRGSSTYASRVLRLALLAPDLVEAILGGWAAQRVMLDEPGRLLLRGCDAHGQDSAPAGRRKLRSASAWTSWRSYLCKVQPIRQRACAGRPRRRGVRSGHRRS